MVCLLWTVSAHHLRHFELFTNPYFPLFGRSHLPWFLPPANVIKLQLPPIPFTDTFLVFN